MTLSRFLNFIGYTAKNDVSEPAPTTSTATIQAALQPGQRPKRWYHLDAKECNALFLFAIRDFIWAYTSSIKVDWSLQESNEFWHNSLGQQLWSTIGVTAAVPFSLLASYYYFGENLKNSLIFSGISALTSISSIIPWDGFAEVGRNFFSHLGYNEITSNYLASVFPGPGLAEGPVETLTHTALSYQFDPTFTFNGMSFVLGLSPIAYVSGDLWLTIYTAFSDIANDNLGGQMAQATAVCLTQLLLNYLTMKTINAISDKYKICRQPIEQNQHSLFAINTASDRQLNLPPTELLSANAYCNV